MLNYETFFYVLCPFKMCTLHNFLSSEALSNVFLFTIPTHSIIDSHKLVNYVVCCLSLSILPLIFPVSVKFSKPCILIICPRNFRCLLLILNMCPFCSLFLKFFLLLTHMKLLFRKLLQIQIYKLYY